MKLIRPKCRLSRVAALAVLSACAAAHANLLDANPASSTFNNPSFERPDTNFVSVSVEKWTITGPLQIVDVPGIGQVPVVAGCGIFENPAIGAAGRIEGADGTQLAYIFANSIPDAFSNQPMDHGFTQILPLTFQAGQQYELAIGIASAQASPPPDSVLTMSLFAFDSANPSVEQLLASQNVNITQINGSSLTDFLATTGAIGGTAIGKQIGIRIQTHTDPRPASAQGQFDFDNVRLNVVPEPATIGLLSVGLAAAASRRSARNSSPTRRGRRG